MKKQINKITNPEVWSIFEEGCKVDHTLEKMSNDLEEENKNDNLQNGIERNWTLLKNVIEPLEHLIRKMDTELGGKQYKYMNQMIKISNEIHTALLEKKKSWKKSIMRYSKVN